MEPLENSEKNILRAAREEFIQAGFSGARMQAIANRAGVNKALLHYYFRSKDKLYKAALFDITNTFFNTIEQKLANRPEITDFESMIRLIVETHIGVMCANPYFPRMIFREILDGGNMMPVIAKEMIAHYGDIPAKIMRLYNQEITTRNIAPTKTVHVILNIMGMCIITYLVQPFAEPLSNVFETSIKFNELFFKDRIDSIISMVKNGIFSKDTK